MIKKIRFLILVCCGCFIHGALAKVEEQLVFKTYPVYLTGQEASAREVQRAIYQYSPLSQWFPEAARHYDGKNKGGKVIGVTHFVPKISWVSRPRKDGLCQLESYIVVHAAAIYLPEVTDNPSLPSTVKAWFMQEYERIKAHELIHHAYNQEYLNRLERYLSEMPYEDSCDALTQTIKDYSKKLGEYTKAQHNQFDDREYNQHVTMRNYEARLAFENEKARLINEAAQELNQPTQASSVIVDGKAPSPNANQVEKKQQVMVKKETKRSQSSSYLRWFLLVLVILGVCVFVTFAYVLWRTYQNQGGKSRR